MSLISVGDIKKHFVSYVACIYRLVEGQHYISTRKLVDNDSEHAILEQLLDHSKPPVNTSNRRGELHYLLYTPFRYPPLREGGRFHVRTEQSIFYGSETLETAMAEIAYKRLLFRKNSEAVLEEAEIPYTHFAVDVSSERTTKLTQAPFDVYRNQLSNPHSYAESQPVGRSMRDAGSEIFTYFSSRNKDGINVGLFSTNVFMQNHPIAGKQRSWNLYETDKTVEFYRIHILSNAKEKHIFSADALLTQA